MIELPPAFLSYQQELMTQISPSGPDGGRGAYPATGSSPNLAAGGEFSKPPAALSASAWDQVQRGIISVADALWVRSNYRPGVRGRGTGALATKLNVSRAAIQKVLR